MDFFLTNPECRDLFVACGTKFGKAVDVNELIPTPKGFKRMGEIREGDYVFSEHGKPVRVEYATDYMYNHRCVEVVFSDGNTVVVDEEHLWQTETHQCRKSLARVISKVDRCKSTNYKPEVVTTKEISETLMYKTRPNHSVDLVSSPAEFEEKELPIEPYTLGVWLGDGCSYSSRYSSIDEEISDYVNAYKCGYQLWNVPGLHSLIRKNGLKKNKHIPHEYLISSPAQRLALLQGLMDTDGTVSKRGDCCFDNTNKNLADGVALLAQSLGIKVKRAERIGKLNGIEHKLCYRVMFTTDIPVFKLKRKLARMREVTLKSKKRYIVAVKPVETRPVRCIRVDSPTHLFLVTEAFIPTHNTLSASEALAKGLISKPNAMWRWIAPQYSQCKIGLDYIQKQLPNSKDFKVNRSDMTLKCLPLDSYIDFMHASNYLALEGFATAGTVFDEAAKIRKEAYEANETTRTRTLAKQIYTSTPLGKNHFYDGFMEAREEMALAKKQIRLPRKIAITARTEDNPFIPRESIEHARKTLPERLFRQYYLAEFVDDADVFGSYRNVFFGDKISYDGDACLWIHPKAKESRVVIGADWAKTQDFTVFIAFDIDTKRVVGFQRFHKKLYTEAIRSLIIFSKNFKEVATVWHDKTGVGQPIDDQLSYTDLVYKGVTFTNQWKTNAVNSLITSIEHKSIELPYWDTMDKELGAFEVKVNELGSMIYSAPSGQHDDVVCALILAHAALMQYSDMNLEVRFLEDLTRDSTLDVLSPLEQFYLGDTA